MTMLDQTQLTASNLYGFTGRQATNVAAPATRAELAAVPGPGPGGKISAAAILDDPTAWYVLTLGLAILAARVATTGHVL